VSKAAKNLKKKNENPFREGEGVRKGGGTAQGLYNFEKDLKKKDLNE